jgi:site-specific DNA-methyltransferase (adenine-specific)
MSDLYDALVTWFPIGIGLQELIRSLTVEFHRLKPGAHAVVRATSGQIWNTARALEDVGFVIRDVVVNVRDRSADRDAFLTSLTPEQREAFERLWPSLLSNKPAIEIWWLARKPIQEKSVSEQVLTTGTGALNIDGCRVASADTSYFVPVVKGRSGGMTPSDPRSGKALGMFAPGKGFIPSNNPLGRWPANLVLQHGLGCKRIGTKIVKGGNDPRRRDGTVNHGGEVYGGHLSGGIVHDSDHDGYGKDGLETVEAWECSPSCPVRTLDEQSGQSASSVTVGVLRYGRSAGIMGKVGALRDGRPEGHADSGGASRFFNTFSSDAELLDHLTRLITPPGGRVLDPFAATHG